MARTSWSEVGAGFRLQLLLDEAGDVLRAAADLAAVKPAGGVQ
ncbi:MAG TPA: hypothetical protein VJ756_15750 [Terriglobales bacterium]|nr:hypothetical protein [Terriglobales bacterium]